MNRKDDWMKNFKVITIDGGDTVLCDMCNQDWTNSEVSGGFLFLSKAICPDCEEGMRKNIIKYNEEHFIRGTCPENMSFYDWIMSMRK
jgi:NAD-dependent SIR2 family protein deacetylase